MIIKGLFSVNKRFNILFHEFRFAKPQCECDNDLQPNS